jgi:Type IV secretion system pilin
MELGYLIVLTNNIYLIHMNFIQQHRGKFFTFILSLMFPIVSFAQSATCDPASGKICNPITTSTLSGLIQNLLTKAVAIGLPIVVLAVVYSGFLFVSARGNSEKLTKAKDTLLYTLIGAAILLGSWAIAMLIQSTVTALT